MSRSFGSKLTFRELGMLENDLQDVEAKLGSATLEWTYAVSPRSEDVAHVR